MNEQIGVSIICNTYNHGSYIRDALESFVMQKTDFQFEVLVHDDASTDNTAEVVREYEEKYPNLIKPIYQTVNQHSQKVNINKNFQLPRIKGKYVALCEGDDYWTDPLKLQKQYDFMENHPEYSLCACSVAWLNMETGKQFSQCTTTVDRDISIEEIIEEKKGRIFQTASMFIKADVFSERPQWLYSFPIGDTSMAMHAALNGKIRMMAEEMAVYRNMAVGSWTARMRNSDHRNKMYNGIIEGMKHFNEATDYQYDAVVSHRILVIKYNMAKKNRDLKALRSEELNGIYRSRSFAQRTADVLYCKSPKFYGFVMKVLGKA